MTPITAEDHLLHSARQGLIYQIKNWEYGSLELLKVRNKPGWPGHNCRESTELESWEAVSCDQCEYKNLIKFIMRYHDSSHHGQTSRETAWWAAWADWWAGLLTVIVLYLSEIFMIQYQGWIFASFLSSLKRHNPGVGIITFKVQSRGEETNISNSMIYFSTIWTNWAGRRLETAHCIIGLPPSLSFWSRFGREKRLYNYRNWRVYLALGPFLYRQLIKDLTLE